VALSDWWARTYGIDTWEEFHEVAGQYVPPLALYGFGLTQEQTSHYAYENPFSSFGGVANVLLAGRRLLGLSDAQALASAEAHSRYSAAAAPATSSTPKRQEVPLIIANTYLVAINGLSGGQDVVSVIGVQGSGSGQSLEAATAVKNAYVAAGGPLSQKTNLYTMQSVSAMDLSSLNGDISVLSHAATGGVATTAVGFNGACALIKWNGGTRSRSSRGRLYHSNLSEAQIETNGRTLVATAVTNLRDAYSLFRTSLSGAGFPLVVISRKLATAYPVTSVACESILATQRRRVR
jgi:hypothetical protein